jgi:hypothetical protein
MPVGFGLVVASAEVALGFAVSLATDHRLAVAAYVRMHSGRSHLAAVADTLQGLVPHTVAAQHMRPGQPVDKLEADN